MANGPLDAMDEIGTAKSLVNLIDMTTRNDQNISDRQDADSIAVACHAVRERLETAQAILEKMKGSAV